MISAMALTGCGSSDREADGKNTPAVQETNTSIVSEEPTTMSDEATDEMTSSEETILPSTEQAQVTEQKDTSDKETTTTKDKETATTTITDTTRETTTKAVETTTKAKETTTEAKETTTKANETSTVVTTTTPAQTMTTETETKYDINAVSEANAVNYRAYYEEILILVNEIRAEAGVGPLVLDDQLCKAATMRAVEMDYANIFSHTRPDGSSCFTVLEQYNISYWSCGENIAAGYNSPQDVVEGWKNSSGHYANMINGNFSKLGVGYAKGQFGQWPHYWVQLFTN